LLQDFSPLKIASVLFIYTCCARSDLTVVQWGCVIRLGMQSKFLSNNYPRGMT